MENMERLEAALMEFVERVAKGNGDEGETKALPKVAKALADILARELEAE